MEKMVYTLSKMDLMEKLITEKNRVEEKKLYKEIKKLDFIIKAVNLLDDGISLKVEGVRGNKDGREMVNVGSVVECLVKHYRNGYSEIWKSFSDDTADSVNGIMNWEIKASLPNARNTALTEEKNLILVNTAGVFLITKKASGEIMKDSQGRFYENVDYSAFEGVRHYKKMEKAFGF